MYHHDTNNEHKHKRVETRDSITIVPYVNVQNSGSKYIGYLSSFLNLYYILLFSILTF